MRTRPSSRSATLEVPFGLSLALIPLLPAPTLQCQQMAVCLISRGFLRIRAGSKGVWAYQPSLYCIHVLCQFDDKPLVQECRDVYFTTRTGKGDHRKYWEDHSADWARRVSCHADDGMMTCPLRLAARYSKQVI